MNTEKYFKILGIDHNTSPEEAKKAYKDLIDHWYTDSKSDDLQTRQNADNKIKEITEAYETVLPFFNQNKLGSEVNDEPEDAPKTWQAFILPVIIMRRKI